MEREGGGREREEGERGRRENNYRPTTSSFGNCLVMEMSFNSFSIRRMFSLQSVATCINCIVHQLNQYLVLVSVESISCASVS